MWKSGKGKAGHECTHGLPGSELAGILVHKTCTQNRTGLFPWVTHTRESSTCGCTSTHSLRVFTGTYEYTHKYIPEVEQRDHISTTLVAVNNYRL